MLGINGIIFSDANRVYLASAMSLDIDTDFCHKSLCTLKKQSQPRLPPGDGVVIQRVL